VSRIEGLLTIATNLAWSWNPDARALFRRLDPSLWHRTRHNPLDLLRRVDPGRLAACAADPAFLAHHDRVLKSISRLSDNAGTWFATAFPSLQAQSVAYFCAEFGLHNSVPIYSGGLGVLAGDHCKAASDLGVPLVGVGLLYTKGYFDQRVWPDGRQEDAAEEFDPAVAPLVPVPGPGGRSWLTTVETSGRCVHVGAWTIRVGRVTLFLLDTNLEENDPADRELLHKLYAGGPELRLRQEWILGIGGVRVLRALGIQPAAWHANEGHAAFMLVERLRELHAHGVSPDDAVRRVRAASVFTTHTPVPAGHDTFSVEQLADCGGRCWETMGITRDAFLRLGRHPTADGGAFHMTVAAIRLSSRVNGVALAHGAETRRIWHSLWPARDLAAVPIGHVTNGAHLRTWMAHPVQELLSRHLGHDWLALAERPDLWQRTLSLDPAALWQVHLHLKDILLEFIREEARRRWRADHASRPDLAGAGALLSPGALTIGFARRFAAYKRADLVFRDPDRLRALLTDPARPVQLIFAGKAHPADEAGKKILQNVHAHTLDPAFEGRIAFLEDYELHLAHHLIQGVDLWLNLPLPPLEACGTSGMKAGLNGVPQLSTADGWWAEGYTGSNGWLVPAAPEGADVTAHDADHLYALLENQVVPLFHERDEAGVPVGWTQRMRHALAVAGERFTAERMVRAYVEQYYVPALRGDAGRDDPPTA